MDTQPTHTAGPTATPPTDDLYTVGQVAALARVTVRTLHHYDRIGLLSPSRRSARGYRLYGYDDLERLRQIRLMRELRFSLEAIGQMLEAPAYDRRSALIAQRELLRERQERTDSIIRGVDRALTALEEETTMDATEMFEGLEDFDHAQYEDEVKERWGDTDAYRESMRRTRRYGKDDWARIRKEGDGVFARLAELMAEGAHAAGRAAMDLAEEHRSHIDRWFYPCSHEMHRCLAEMYTADARFTEYFEKRAEGLALFVQDAIMANEARWRNRR
ncbi:MAG: MerR family transcriptional regulator [Gemmatimonadota bacterium]|nr:MerR family transcriptional regulator [Gemmatimonadota bacterium]